MSKGAKKKNERPKSNQVWSNQVVGPSNWKEDNKNFGFKILKESCKRRRAPFD